MTRKDLSASMERLLELFLDDSSEKPMMARPRAPPAAAAHRGRRGLN